MLHDQPLVAFDFCGLDRLHIGNGQFRYCIDLLNGLASAPREFRFLVAGSGPEPHAEIRGVFRTDAWRYAQFSAWRGRGGAYLDHMRFARWLRGQGAALLHAPHTFVPLTSTVPVAVTIYDMMSELFPEYRDRVRSRPYRLFRLAVRLRRARTIAISESTAADLHRLWRVPRASIEVVPLGIEPARPTASPRAALADAARTPFILSPYNLEPRKNLSALLTSVAALRRTCSGMRLVLYGGAALTGDRETAFRASIRELRLDDAVLLTGFLAPDELAYLYANCSLFVFPSLYEGFGLPVLEAMAAGRCVVARNCSATAEVLGDAGVQVDTADAAALTQAIEQLLNDPARRASLGAAARVRAARFSRTAMVDGTLAAYRRALARK